MVGLCIYIILQLEDGQHAHELKWLPAKLPDNVRVVISVQRKSACYKVRESAMYKEGRLFRSP